jgi:curved DNA-binding protein CbpA
MTSKVNLYKVLGIESNDGSQPRHVSSGEIHDAYRARVKRVHPDVGGDPEHFRIVQMAWDVLRDPERRRRYDETGEYGPTEADNLDSQALAIVQMAIDAALDNERIDVEAFDLTVHINQAIEAADNQARKAIEDGGRRARRIQRMLDRFKRQDGREATITGGLKQHLAQAEASITDAGRARRAFARARELVAEHRYEATGYQQTAQWYAAQPPVDPFGGELERLRKLRDTIAGTPWPR